MGGFYPDDVSPASFDRYWSDKLSDLPDDDDYWQAVDSDLETIKDKGEPR